MERLTSLYQHTKNTRFNPCYVGSKMESLIFSQEEPIYEVFQSLLCWK